MLQSAATPNRPPFVGNKVYTVTNDLAKDFVHAGIAEEVDDLTPLVAELKQFHLNVVPTSHTSAAATTRLRAEGLLVEPSQG